MKLYEKVLSFFACYFSVDTIASLISLSTKGYYIHSVKRMILIIVISAAICFMALYWGKKNE